MPLERQLSQQRLTGNDIGEQKEARKNEEKHRIETKKNIYLTSTLILEIGMPIETSYKYNIFFSSFVSNLSNALER